MPVPDPIAQLLAGQYPDPETGELLAAETRALLIEDTLEGSEAEVCAALGLGKRIAVIADVDTDRALGARVARALAARFTVQHIVLDREPHADADTLARLAAQVEARTDAIVVVGSGTLNDLGKLVALERGCPQVVFATAPSMNGYTSVSASLIEHGFKRSVRAATPVAAFFDLRVLAAAPPRLIRAGLGDSVCRSTAQADWLLQHLVLDRPYREAPFALLAGDEVALFARSRELAAGDLAALRHLVRTLVLSGFGMTICNGSYPASQGEHLLSHYLEMVHPIRALHGEQIGVCTIAMAQLQDRWLSRAEPPVVRPAHLERADLIAHLGPERGEAAWSELDRKRMDPARAAAATARLAQTWGAIRARIASVVVGAPRLVEVLAAAGAPTEPAALGWPAELWASALAHAHEIRDRYGFLDLEAHAA
jgi:glycerol-1-phosphate dehydrogenase [NAD(P)+]